MILFFELLYFGTIVDRQYFLKTKTHIIFPPMLQGVDAIFYTIYQCNVSTSPLSLEGIFINPPYTGFFKKNIIYI